MKSILLCFILVVALCDSCGGNCISGNCPSCPCGSDKKIVNISVWCARYSWNQNCCKCIVSHESGGNANAMSYRSYGAFSVGLMQIEQVNINLS